MSDLPSEAPRDRIELTFPGELTPVERALRRRNRRWLLAIAIPALIVGAAALALTLDATSSSPTVTPSHVPAGFKAVTDDYFGYAVPSSWATNDLFTDDVGDLDTSGSTGWVAEHLQVRTTPPSAGESPPPVFATFGLGRATPYRLGPARLVEVPGAQAAYEYQMTRPGGFAATAVDAWASSTQLEIWMLVHASPALTQEVVATLKA